MNNKKKKILEESESKLKLIKANNKKYEINVNKNKSMNRSH